MYPDLEDAFKSYPCIKPFELELLQHIWDQVIIPNTNVIAGFIPAIQGLGAQLTLPCPGYPEQVRA